MAIVANVDAEWACESRGLRTEGGSALSSLKTAVDIVSFIVRWLVPAAKGARRWGSGIFGSLCRIMVPTTLNIGKRAGTTGFSMPVRLASGALYDRTFPPWRFDGDLHVT